MTKLEIISNMKYFLSLLVCGLHVASFPVPDSIRNINELDFNDFIQRSLYNEPFSTQNLHPSDYYEDLLTDLFF